MLRMAVWIHDERLPKIIDHSAHFIHRIPGSPHQTLSHCGFNLGFLAPINVFGARGGSLEMFRGCSSSLVCVGVPHTPDLFNF